MAWEEIVRGAGRSRRTPEWFDTPCITIRQIYIALNRRFQKQFKVEKGTAAIVRWDDERRCIGLEIGPAEKLPSGFSIHIGGGKWNLTTATIQCSNFCRRLLPYKGKSYRAVLRPGETIIEVALLPDNEIV